jgi:hypothetical protein
MGLSFIQEVSIHWMLPLGKYYENADRWILFITMKDVIAELSLA